MQDTQHRLCRASQARSGLSLLEVMLALAILGVAVAILSQAMQVSADNGIRAERMAQAQLICESKMAEVVAGLVPMQPIQWTPVTSISGSTWYYQMETMDAEQSGMIGVRMMVTDDPELNTGIRFQLVRWVIDPNLGLDAVQDPSSSGSTGGTATGSTVGGAASTTSGGSR